MNIDVEERGRETLLHVLWFFLVRWEMIDSMRFWGGVFRSIGYGVFRGLFVRGLI